MCVSGVRPPPRFFQPPLRFLLSASVDSSNDLCRAPRAPPNRNPVGPQKAEDRDRRVAESPASRQAIGWLPTRLHLGDAVRRKPWSPAASLPSVGTPKRRGSAVLPNRLPLVRGLYLMKYGCPNNNSNIVAKRLLFNPAGEGPARARAVQG